MRVEAEIDVRALRRIALLVRRAKEDWGPCCVELNEIADVLERMKRNVALRTPFSGDDLRTMVSLVRDLACESSRHERLHDPVVSELRDLAEQLTP